jgi:hypothetical protein
MDDKIQALEAEFGNDGYAAFFKLLEGSHQKADGVLDLSHPAMLKAYASRCHIEPDRFVQIVAFAADLGLFDAEQWERRRITSVRIQRNIEALQSHRDRSRDQYKNKKEEEEVEESKEKTQKLRRNSAETPKKPKAPNYDPAFIGTEPIAGDGLLPPALRALFESQGKEEAFRNVWLTEAQSDALIKRFGDDRVTWAGKALTDWSLNLDVSAKTNLAGWQSYRMKRDHAGCIRNQILRKWPELKGVEDGEGL